MHQTIECDPCSPEAWPNLWTLYLDSESLQRAVDCWPASISAERFLALLFSGSTEKVVITNVSSTRPGTSIHFEVHGRCYQKRPCVFWYELKPKELTQSQKVKLRDFVKLLYAKEAPNYPMAKRICRALGVIFK